MLLKFKLKQKIIENPCSFPHGPALQTWSCSGKPVCHFFPIKCPPTWDRQEQSQQEGHNPVCPSRSVNLREAAPQPAGLQPLSPPGVRMAGAGAEVGGDPPGQAGTEAEGRQGPGQLCGENGWLQVQALTPARGLQFCPLMRHEGCTVYYS